MSRQMRRRDAAMEQTVTVHAWLMTRNCWEYYLLDPKPDASGNVFSLVMGDETEMGDVSVTELRPYVVSFARGADLIDLAPPDGWDWVE